MKIIITLALLLFSSLAKANNLFEPPSDDISLKLIGAIFGGLVGQGQDPLLEAIKTFNGAMLILGGVLAAYTILAGTLGTAHDGELLGKKFSSVWIPIRYSLGTALIMPVVGGGYATIQAVIIWLVIQGVGLAGQVWSSFQSNNILQQELIIKSNGTNSPLHLAENLFVSYMCVFGNQQAVNDVGYIAEKTMKYKNHYDYGLSQDGHSYYFGNKKRENELKSCGSVTLPNFVSLTEHQKPSNNKGLLGQINLDFTPIDTSPIITAHRNATNSMMGTIQGIATTAISTKVSDGKALYQQIEQAAKTYEQSINQAAAGFNKSYQKKQTNNGWAESGFVFQQVIQDNNAVNNAVSSVSSSNGTVGNIFDTLLFGDAKKYLDLTDKVLVHSKTNQSDNFLMKKGDEDNKKVESGSSLSGKIGAAIASVATGIDLYALKDDPRHINIVSNQMGQSLLAFNTAVASVLAIVGFTAGTAANVFGSGVVSAISVFTSFLQIPFAGLWVVGFFCSYVIPLLPAIIFIGVLIGWILQVFQGVIASPLWMVAHLSPNGDDLTGSGRAGYQLVLSLTLRPVLIVFGLMAALIISTVIGELVNKVFFSLLANANGGSIQGIGALVTILFGTTMYAVLVFTLNTKTLSLMHKLPDQILTWIGGHTGGLGDFAEGFEQSAKQSAAGGAGVMLNDLSKAPANLSNSFQRMAGAIPKKPGMKDDNREVKDKHQDINDVGKKDDKPSTDSFSSQSKKLKE